MMGLQYKPANLLSSALLSSLELSDATSVWPRIRALLENASHFCEAVVLKSRTVPTGTTLSLRIIRVRQLCGEEEPGLTRLLREGIVVELMTSGRKLKASREGSK